MNLDPAQYRSGRWFLLGEGLVLIGLGLWGLLAGVSYPDAGSGFAGAVLGAASTLAHSIVLLAFGVLVVVATPWRRPLLMMTGLGIVGFGLLFVIGTVAAVRGEPGILGFDLAESVLHAVLMGFNLALFIWLSANAFEGPVWVRRRRPGGSGIDGSAAR